MKQTTQISILLLIADAQLGMAIAENLENFGHRVSVVSEEDPEDKNMVDETKYDVCLLYSGSESTGLDMRIRKIRQSTNIPLFVIGPQMGKQEVVDMYHSGADDVLEVPISTEILSCKIAALIGRLKEEPEEHLFEIGIFEFDSEKQTLLSMGDHLVRLSGKETELLALLVRHRNQPVDKSVILRKIWKVDNYFNGRSLSVYVNHLRHLLEADPKIRIINIHGKGYKMCIEN